MLWCSPIPSTTPFFITAIFPRVLLLPCLSPMLSADMIKKKRKKENQPQFLPRTLTLSHITSLKPIAHISKSGKNIRGSYFIIFLSFDRVLSSSTILLASLFPPTPRLSPSFILSDTRVGNSTLHFLLLSSLSPLPLCFIVFFPVD